MLGSATQRNNSENVINSSTNGNNFPPLQHRQLNNTSIQMHTQVNTPKPIMVTRETQTSLTVPDTHTELIPKPDNYTSLEILNNLSQVFIDFIDIQFTQGDVNKES